MHKRWLLGCGLFLIPFFAQTQEFKPGYYINEQNDTIRGEIQDNGYIRNSYSCLFRENADAETTEFNGLDIKGYRVGEETRTVRSLELAGKNKVTVEEVFVRTLVKGDLSIITFTDRSGSQRFYLEDSERGPNELTVSTRTIDDRRFTDKRYQGVFKLYTQACSQNLNLDDIGFREKDFVATVIAYNECVGSQSQIAAPTTGGLRFDIMPQAGMTYYSPINFTAVSNVFVIFEEQPDLLALTERDIRPSFQPSAGINFLLSSKKQPNFYFMTGAQYNPVRWESADGAERFAFDILNIPILLQYRFNPKRYTKIVPFAQFGAMIPVVLNYSNTNDGVFNLIELELIDEELEEVERNKVGEAPLVEDDANFDQILQIGAGIHLRGEKSQWMLQVNYGLQVESNLSENLLAKSPGSLELRIGFIPNW